MVDTTISSVDGQASEALPPFRTAALGKHMPPTQRLMRGLFNRPLRFVCVLLISLGLSAGPAVLHASATTASDVEARRSTGLIPIQDQPFYPQLLQASQTWNDVVLDQVVGDSPRTTLMNFYAVMADVGHRADRLGLKSGGMAAMRREKIDDTNLLFGLAVQALDASSIPKSVREDMADEAAIQLKHVLDYVLTHSRQMIDVPDVAGMKQRNDPSKNSQRALVLAGWLGSWRA